MRITIDNLDGGGARDYTAALSTDGPLQITRTRNEAAHCVGMLDINGTALSVPVRHARVAVTNERGAVLFAGYIATEPERVYAGVTTKGAAYRLAFSALADEVSLTSVTPGATHVLGDSNGVLHVSALAPSAARELATDVMLSGEIEPAAYITEYFMGDGTTNVFQLTQAPYHATGSSTVIDERFDEAAINPRVWSVTDTGSFLVLTHAGLTMTGGTGFDGKTTLASADPLEIGGTLVITTDGVSLGAASDGVVCGLYGGAIERDNCFAGFNVKQSSGATVVTPFVNGAEAGTSLTMLNGHRYTLRLRLHCPETVRTAQTYSAVCDGVVRGFGGGTVAAPVTMVFEARDMGSASNTPVTVLHTASLISAPGSCAFVPVNSVQLIGSIGSCSITQAGSAWMVTTTPDGTQTVRVSGQAGDGVDCTISPAGRITFYDGRIPVANERITVSYRGRRRAIARLRDANSIDAETAQWQGKVTHPPARTTADCENAALAMLSFATARSSAIGGTYVMVNPANEVHPGDVLSVASEDGDTLKLMVRSVVIDDGHARPEIATYRIAFANNWIAGLDATLADGVADDALLHVATTAPAPVLANLSALQVVSAIGSALQIDAGTEPPVGGGFEVRRRDWAFGPGTDGDLVLRSPVRSFSIPREAQVERYFVRMYDGAGTPIYSRFSSAVFINLPVA